MSNACDNAGAEGATGRLHEMDALRSGLMLLGVVIHAADPYAVQSRWLVRDPGSSVVFDWLGITIHQFRMPAFFLVSGFFSMLLLRKWSARRFMEDRLRRIGLPLLVTLCTLNLLQVAWLARDSAPAGAMPYLQQVLLPAWRSGHWLGHLWFLVYLLVFCLLASLSAPLLRRLAVPAAWPPRRSLAALIAAGMLAALLPPVLAHWQPQWGQWTVAGLIDPLEWLGYLPFFAAGLLLESDAALLLQFCRFDAGTLLFGVLAWAIAHFTPSPAGTAMKLLHVMAVAALTWTAVRAAFALCHRWLARPSTRWRYLSDASYSIYLLHHVVVVVVAGMLLAKPWPVGLKFVLVVASATVLPLAAHHFLILRQPWLRLLLNGKRLPDARAGRTPLAVTTSSDPRSP